MTDSQEKILLETHGTVQKLAGCLPGMKDNIAENKTDIRDIKKTLPELVSEDNCKSLRNGTIKNHRNVWLIAKDILIILLAMAVFFFGRGIL